jgi:hypothetical protein
MAAGHYVPHYLNLPSYEGPLYRAAVDCGLVRDDGAASVRATIASGLRAGMADPQSLEVEVPLLDVDDDTSAAEDVFWGSRESLAHVRDFARARRAGPLGTLGVVLARVVGATPPFVVLPPLAGGIASLNPFIALVGPSGKGKGKCSSAGRDAVIIEGISEAHLLTPGSGEGVAHMFAHRKGQDLVMHEERVILDAPEVDTLTALNGRRGATLDPELRKAWSGEGLGFGYADPTKRLPIPAHAYRLCLLVGVQPGRAESMFDSADGGTPQRFLWLPVSDPRAPDTRPPEPEPLRWRLPSWPLALHGEKVHLEVCREAAAAVDAESLRSLRDDSFADSLDGHRLLAQLKVAAALALLDGHAGVRADDWRLGGMLLAISDQTRRRVQQRLAAGRVEANGAAARAEAERAVTVERHLAENGVAGARRAILRVLEAHERDGRHPDGQGCHRRCLKDACGTSALRSHLGEALHRAMESGEVAAVEVKQGGFNYRKGGT